MPRYQLSPHVRIVKLLSDPQKKVFVYHSIFGNPRILNAEGLRFLNFFRSPKDTLSVRKTIEGNYQNLIGEFSVIKFLIGPQEDERALLSRQLQVYLKKFEMKETVEHISLSVSRTCNFGCDHCIFFQRSKKSATESKDVNGGAPRFMTWEVAKKCIDSYIEIVEKREKKHCRIHFGNAEPLSNWKVIESCLAYCESFPDFNFEYAINTNLSLLTEKMATVLKKYNVKVATSLDGIGQANDVIRTKRDGNGTFKTIIKKMDLLARAGYPLDGISITVTDVNFDAVDTEIIEFAHGRNMQSIAFDFDLINRLRIPVSSRIEKILRLKETAKADGIFFDGTWGTPFRRLMTRSLLRETYSFCAAVEGKGLTFDTDGTIKACDYSSKDVGHLNQLDDVFKKTSPLYCLIEKRFPGNVAECKGCDIEGFCGGLCNITREVAEQNRKGVIVDNCRFYKSLTRALIERSTAEDPTVLEGGKDGGNEEENQQEDLG